MCEYSKKNWGWGSGGRVGGGQGGCEWRSEAFVKIKKKYIFLGGSGQGVGLGGVSGWMGMEN